MRKSNFHSFAMPAFFQSIHYSLLRFYQLGLAKIKANQALLLRVFIATFLFGLLAHSYCYFNAMYTVDSLAGLVSTEESRQVAWKLNLGRYIQPLNFLFRGAIASPWLLGFLSLIWLSLANFLIIKTFGIKRSWIHVLICGILCTNIPLGTTYAIYIHECDSFMMAFFFSSLAIYCFDRYRKGWIAAAVFIALSLGCYQAYFSTIACFFTLLLVRDCLKHKTVKELFLRGIKIGLTVFAAAVLFIFLYKLAIIVAGVSPVATGNSPLAAKRLTLDVIMTGVSCVGGVLVQFFLNPISAYGSLMTYLNGVIWICYLVAIIRIVKKNQMSLSSTLALLALLLFFLPCMACLSIISPNYYHLVMTYAHYLFYVLVLYLIEFESDLEAGNTASWYVKGVLFLSLSCLIFTNIVYNNQLYTQRHLVRQNSLSFKTRVIAEIERLPDFDIQKNPVVIIGQQTDCYEFSKRPGFEHLQGFGVTQNASLLYIENIRAAFNRSLGYPLQFATLKMHNEWGAKEAVRKMPHYPKPGYCAVVDGCLVIKLSDTILPYPDYLPLW